jgi:hypothetical protein
MRKFHGYRPLTDDKYVIVEASPEEILPLVPAHDLMNEAILEDLPAPLLPSSSEPSPDKNGEVLDLFDPLVTTSPCQGRHEHIRQVKGQVVTFPDLTATLKSAGSFKKQGTEA